MSTPYFEKDIIRILLFSDIHESIPIDQVQPTIKSVLQNNEIDMILIGGDVQCIKHMKDLEEETKDNIVEDDIYLTSFLHEISQMEIPYLWIPGNHDSISSYKDNCSHSVHNRVIDIAPNLTMVGIGGSSPACDINGSIVWKGYPNLTKDIDISNIVKNVSDIPETNSVILFTHCPPSFTPSSRMIKNDVLIMAGSDSLQELYSIIKEHHSVPLYMHGHCHRNLAFNREQDTCVVSAGSVSNGFYTFIDLERRNTNWQVTKYTNVINMIE